MNNTTALPSFNVGDFATYTVHTDSRAGRIIAVSPSGKKVTFQEDKATLLNGCNSDEPDALKFSPGGFCGHTSGEQRWKLEENKEGCKYTFTLRRRQNGEYVWKLVGHGTYSPGCSLRAGQHHHYDFNF